MAEIFRGRMVGVGGFEKPVAIKKILPRLAKDERFIKLLVNEAKINASLSHANIVQIHDLGINEDGEYFLVLEYVDGQDLRAILEEARNQRVQVPRSVGLYVGGEICQALDHAHRLVGPDGAPLGLVHRDVSPANILVSRAGEVKLTDFGIAKHEQEASIVTTLKGKFAYMSPEQARSMPLDQTSDLFSLGLILYEMLVGRRAIAGATDFEVLQAVREARYARPREVVPDFPPELEEILLKALAPRARDRWPSALALGAALREYRFAMAQAGAGAAELAALISKLFPQEEEEDSGKSEFITINTVAGFPIRDDSAPMPTPTPASFMDGPSGQMTPSFDLEPTMVQNDPLKADEPFRQIELLPGRPRKRDSADGADPLPPVPRPEARLIADALFTPAPERLEEFRESAPIHLEDDSTGGQMAAPRPIIESSDSATPISVPAVSGAARSPALSEPPRPSSRSLSASAILDLAPRPSTVVKLRPRRWPAVTAMVVAAAGALGWLAWSNRPPARTVFVVDSSPVGAEVYVDDRLMGATPLRAPVARDGRDHDIELRKVGYWPDRKRARGEGDSQSVSVNLEPARTELKVRSKPSHARVTVDGASACETPCIVENVETRRKHSVSIQLAGHVSWEREIDIPATGVTPIEALLAPLPVSDKVAGANKVAASAQVAARAPSALGTVRRVEGEAPISARAAAKPAGDVVLKSEPWARIIVDGKDSGRTTSAAPFKLPVGKHEITLVNPPLKLKKTLTIVVKTEEPTRKFIPLR